MRLVTLIGLSVSCAEPQYADQPTPGTTPAVDAVHISPPEPVPGAPLLCSAEVEESAAVLAYAWSVGGAAAGDGPWVSEGTTQAGEEWTCTVTPTHDGARGRAVSAAVQIGGGGTRGDTGTAPENTPPEAPGISVQPATPGVGEPIACVVDRASVDVDGDTVWYRFNWTHNDEETDITDGLVPPDSVGQGDRWTCIVTPTDGIDEGEPATATAEVGGCDGGSLAFTGEDHVRVDDAAGLTLDGDWTIEAYVKRDAAATDDPMVIASHYVEGSGGWWLGVAEMGPNRSLMLHLDNGSSSVEIIGPPVEASRWVHVAAVHDGGAVTLYVDGRKSDAASGLTPATVDGPLFLGTLVPSGTVDETLDGGWHGLLDQFHLSIVPLYSAEFIPSLQLEPDFDSLLFWELGEGAGTSTTDSATGAYPGVLEGPTWTADSPCLGG